MQTSRNLSLNTMDAGRGVPRNSGAGQQLEQLGLAAMAQDLGAFGKDATRRSGRVA